MTANLFDAIADHDLDRLAELLAEGADPNALHDEWPRWRPLHAAIEELEDGGSLDALVLLLARGAEVDGLQDPPDATPLLMACFRQQRDAVRLLLGARADPNTVGGEGDSPLRCWVEQGDQVTAAVLLGAGADRTLDSWGGIRAMNALGIAASRLDVSMIQLLLRHGADPQAQDGDRRTAARRLPPRTADNAEAWDTAARLLGAETPG